MSVAAKNLEKFQLKKQDLLDILEAMEYRWNKNFRKNVRFILSAKAAKAGIMMTNEAVISEFWLDFIKAANAVMELNEMSRLKGERPDTAFLKENLIKKIKAGELF